MFFKKKNRESERIDYGILGADMHSHLLPGIDDGAQDLETSLALIRGMVSLGFKKLITTPHIMWDMYKNTNEVILAKLEELKAKLKEENIDVQLEAAAEYFIDDHLEQILKEKQPLLSFGPNKLVLVEFSMASPPFDLKEALFEMQLQGYQPVIAHPERYTYLEGNKSYYTDLKDSGYMFQLNALSLTGHYGKQVSQLATYLCKQGFYELIGSDLHHIRHLEMLAEPAVIHNIKKVLDEGKIINSQL
jgi:protein-tyrosine phosphatase